MKCVINSFLIACMVMVSSCSLGASGPKEKPADLIREDWPAFLGPQQNSTSRENHLLLEWPEDGPPELWSRDIGVSFGAPVISNGKLIIFHRVGDEEVIECVDALDGSKVFWQDKYPTTYQDRYRYNGGPRSSATTNENRVYAFGAQGVLTCVDFETGARLWQRNLNTDFEAEEGFFGVGTAPVIEGDLLLLNVGGANGAGVVAVNKLTGETAWKTSDDSASYSTPIVKTVNGERLAIFYTGEGLLVVEPETGKERYTYPFRSTIRESAIAASPVLIDDVVFLSATYDIGSVALQLTPDGLKEVWKNPKSLQTHWATSVFLDGKLYGLHGRHQGNAHFRCIDFATGELEWEAPDDYGRNSHPRLGRASFIMAQGHIIALGENGSLALIEVNPERFTEKKRAQLLKGPVYTPPVLAQGLLYIRNEYKIICLDLRADGV